MVDLQYITKDTNQRILKPSTGIKEERRTSSSRLN